jgi:hypothetical protein
VAATSEWNAGTGTVTNQSTSAVAAGTVHFNLTLSQVGSGSVRSNVSSFGLSAPGSRTVRLGAGRVVTLVATTKPGYVTIWSQACHGGAATCRVTVRRSTSVRVTFKPELTLPTFYFATNMSNITMPTATIAQLMSDLVRLSKSHVTTLNVYAYADYRNGTSYNLVLSQNRANSVRAFLDTLFAQLGIPAMSVHQVGLGILRASQVLQLDRKAVLTF